MDEFFKPGKGVGIGPAGDRSARQAGGDGGSSTCSTDDETEEDDEELQRGTGNFFRRLCVNFPPFSWVAAGAGAVGAVVGALGRRCLGSRAADAADDYELGMSKHHHHGGSKRHRRRALKQHEKSPPVDGVLAVICEELLLRRERLLGGYWEARGRLDREGVLAVQDTDVALVQVGGAGGVREGGLNGGFLGGGGRLYWGWRALLCLQ